ncbi:MAG: AAA family ATPase [Kurthia sp.]|nr:AAA family ATPase [Candidatus Kurthia equi]
MSLFVIMGAQAAGKMTVGKALEKKIDGRLLYNHQTLDLFANYLGFTREAFRLSDELRKNLFKAFVENKATNPTESIIFTVVVNFDAPEDHQFLQEIANIFLEAKEAVYFIELVTSLEERLKRNIHEARLEAKPSKRDIIFSENELKITAEKYRLQSDEGEMSNLHPEVHYLKIDNTYVSEETVAQRIINQFDL